MIIRSGLRRKVFTLRKIVAAHEIRQFAIVIQWKWKERKFSLCYFALKKGNPAEKHSYHGNL